jgi:pimeloyl-ACP methyl ester carboxylesterase
MLPNAVLVLHGYTMNGRFGASVAQMLKPLGEDVRVVSPDAPLECSEAAVTRFYEGTGVRRGAGPHLTWWRASDDNSVYEGWDASRALIERTVSEHAIVGVIGFSQGAMVASACAALAARGELPGLRFAILVAGRVPRAHAMRSWFERPIELESLHVWGERDPFSAEAAPELVRHFAKSSRQEFVWAGAHSFPTSGPAAEVMREFVRAHLDRG